MAVFIAAEASRTDRLEEAVKELQVFTRRQDDTISKLVQGQRQLHLVALRCLLDNVRQKILGRELTRDEHGNWWNNHLTTLTEPDLNGLPMGLPDLTKFGLGTQQRRGSDAAHNIEIETIRQAVMEASSDDFQALYRWTYAADPAAEVIS